VEDAAVLGALFSRLGSTDQVATLLYAYQDLRKVRADRLVTIEEHNVDVAIFGAPRVRGGLVHFNAIPAGAPSPPPGDGPTEAELAEIAELWSYYAIDAADEWWVQWGMLRERSRLLWM
jgi:salicylate hydroxylase